MNRYFRFARYFILDINDGSWKFELKLDFRLAIYSSYEV